MKSLPLTIISGYLGAGKTSLINRLLAEDHGLNLMVIVNDFGSINIDADLIEVEQSNLIALSNGCVCCTIADDLTQALQNALQRDPRPDHLVIEASGIADPAAIAGTARSVPDLGYGGILTLVDALNIDALLDDPATAAQVSQQINSADLVLVTKTDKISADLATKLSELGIQAPARLGDDPLADLLLAIMPRPQSASEAKHPAYTRWHHDSETILDRTALGEKLANRPNGLYRLKGVVMTNDGGYEIHAVGQHTEARRTSANRTTLVALGPSELITTEQINNWWSHTS